MDVSSALTKPIFLMLKPWSSFMHPKANNDAGLFFYKSHLTEGLSNLWELRINITSNKTPFSLSCLNSFSGSAVRDVSLDQALEPVKVCAVPCSVLGLLLWSFTVYTRF